MLKQFQINAKKRNIDIGNINEILPCSLEAVDNLDQIYLTGTSKLEQEKNYAMSIPSTDRRLINKKFLNIEQMKHPND